MRIERHIFGSKDGYRTLAHSAGLSATECKSLEGFAFGTPYDPALRASLAKNPAYWSRPVGRDKRAITRIMLGQPDDAGRPTLVFISVVISAGDWDTVLQGDAGPLLRMADLWRWNPSTPLEPSQSISPHPSALRLNDQSIQRVLGLVSLLEQAWSFRKPVMIREGAYSFEEILTVERLLPPPIRRTYSSVYRGIIADMPVTLNCLARSVQANSGNPFRSLAGAVSPYAKSLAREGLLEGRIPSSLVHRYSHFSKPVVEAIDDGAGSEDMIKVPHLPKVRAGPNLSAVTLAVAAAALILGFLIGWLANRPPPNPWRDIAAMAIAIPLEPGDGQVQAFDTLDEEINKLPDSDTEYETLKAEILDQRTAAIRARNAARVMPEVDSDTTIENDLESSFPNDDHASDQQQPDQEHEMTSASDTNTLENSIAVIANVYLLNVENLETEYPSSRTPLSDQDLSIANQLVDSIEALQKIKPDSSELDDARKRLDKLLERRGSTPNQRNEHTPDKENKLATELEFKNVLNQIDNQLMRDNLTKEDRDALKTKLETAAELSQQLKAYSPLSRTFSSLGFWIAVPWQETTSDEPENLEEDEAIRVAMERCKSAARNLSAKKNDEGLSQDKKREAVSNARTRLNQAIDEFKKVIEEMAKS